MHPAQKMSLIHHRDIANAMILALAGAMDGRIVNIVDEAPTSIYELLALIGETMEPSAEPLAVSGASTTGEIRLAYDLLYCLMSLLHDEDVSAAALKLDAMLVPWRTRSWDGRLRSTRNQHCTKRQRRGSSNGNFRRMDGGPARLIVLLSGLHGFW